MDRIELTGLCYYGYVGYLPEEQVLGQWFEVELTLWVDLSVAGQTDQIEDTLDYRAVIDRVQHLIETARFKTIERLNTAITEAILDLDRIQTVRSRLIKVSPPIPGFRGQVVVEMIRTKDEPLASQPDPGGDSSGQ